MGAFNFGSDSSSSRSSSNQRVWDPQAQALQQMYGYGNQMFGNMMPYMNMGFGMMPQLQQMMQQGFGMGRNAAGQQIKGGAYGDTSRYNDMIYDAMANPQQSNVSKMYESIVGGPGNTYADPLVDAMRTGMDRNRQTVNNQNALNAAAYGQGGSSRHAMTNAMNDQQFNRDMNQAEMGIREGNYERDMGWKMDIARMADQNRQADLDRAYNMVEGANQAQQWGGNYMPTMQNLGMGMMAPWMQSMYAPMQAFNMYSNAMGDPTVLTDTKSRGKSSGYNIGLQGGS